MSITSMPAIKRYFESEPHGRKCTMEELKALSPEERTELGQMAAKELGEEWVAAK